MSGRIICIFVNLCYPLAWTWPSITTVSWYVLIKNSIIIFIKLNLKSQKRKFSFTNRLNDIIALLSDCWLDESEKQMKKTLKTKILDIVPAKSDSWIICDADIFYS